MAPPIGRWAPWWRRAPGLRRVQTWGRRRPPSVFRGPGHNFMGRAGVPMPKYAPGRVMGGTWVRYSADPPPPMPLVHRGATVVSRVPPWYCRCVSFGRQLFATLMCADVCRASVGHGRPRHQGRISSLGHPGPCSQVHRPPARRRNIKRVQVCSSGGFKFAPKRFQVCS